MGRTQIAAQQSGEGASLPELAMSFAREGLQPPGPLPSWHGPRRWWGGPLDVEGLALASVAVSAAAIEQFTGPSLAVTIDSSRVAAAFNSLGHLRIDGRQPEGFAALSGFFPTSDGWVRTHANYPHHAHRLSLALGARTVDGVAGALLEMPAFEAEERICAAGGIAAAVRTREGWVSSSMATPTESVQNWATFDLSPAGGRKVRGGCWSPTDGAERPLAGLRVLDFTRVVAGPTSSRTLAAWGADVLRVDPPGMPELLSQHVDTGFGKRSAIIDLTNAEEASRTHALLEAADVVLIGYRNGSLDRFGLSPLELRERYPRLVIVTLDAWGQTGPWANRRGFDSIVQAAVGIADLYRDEDGRPGALPVQALDHATGYGMAAAAVALVAARAREGVTGTARLSLLRTSDSLFATPIPDAPVENLGDPGLARVPSAYGELVYAQPPFDLNGKAVTYPWPPRRYGSDIPIWR
ncbi:CoA transferase [Pseudarthrobacter sp. PS3-L1]|uniref:CoA transferase n=1 Tax=Pseudarthrobacter sp. PS3-L1 TaxID=3046207 RepID=UPI0024B9388B|nr:CoA transferase [Pseudarthrobacter sp. PS3-L1]MDJ0321996.1 CoA transferase [Pseudarthrobacter sp. PS3-L1]